jgi:hypothetical protein
MKTDRDDLEFSENGIFGNFGSVNQSERPVSPKQIGIRVCSRHGTRRIMRFNKITATPYFISLKLQNADLIMIRDSAQEFT